MVGYMNNPCTIVAVKLDSGRQVSCLADRCEIQTGRCPRCNGLMGSECLGGSDCDINVDLGRDGVDPSAWRNQAL